MTVTIPGNLNKAPQGKAKHIDKASILRVLVVFFLGGLYHLGKPPFRFSRLQKNLQTLQKMNPTHFCQVLFTYLFCEDKGWLKLPGSPAHTSLCSLEKFADRRRWVHVSRFRVFLSPNHSTMSEAWYAKQQIHWLGTSPKKLKKTHIKLLRSHHSNAWEYNTPKAWDLFFCTHLQ